MLVNLNAFLEENPDIRSRSTAPNGALYMAPHDGIGFSNQRTWMSREDVFEEHNLEQPETWEELYEVSKTLKEIYPDSYPFSFRGGLGQINVYAPTFGTWRDIYQDFETGEVRFGPIEDNYKELVEYLHRFYTEGLIAPDFLSMDVNMWMASMTTGQSFITSDFIGRIESLNNTMEVDGAKLVFMAPPAGGSNGVQALPKTDHTTTGLGIYSLTENREAAFRYLDFFYSEEGVDIQSWGVEGETYDIVDGERVMKDEFVDFSDIRTKMGIATWGTYGNFDADAGIALVKEEERPAYTQAASYNLPAAVIEPNFSSEEREVVSIEFESIRRHRDETIANFIIGQRPLSEWDDYVQEIEDLGLQSIIDLYQTGWDRQQ